MITCVGSDSPPSARGAQSSVTLKTDIRLLKVEGIENGVMNSLASESMKGLLSEGRALLQVMEG